MAKEKAQIEVSLDGSDAAVSDAKQLDAQLNKWGTSAANASKKVGASLLGMAGTALQAGAALQGLSIMGAIEQAKQLDLTTAKLGQSAKLSGDALKEAFNKSEQKTLTSAGAMAEFSRALGRTTYDGRFAVEAVNALSEEALAMGRDLGDELPLGVALFDLGVKAKDLGPELGRIRDIAEQVGTVGGPTALNDTLASLGPVLQTVSADTDKARTRLEALVAVLGKGLKPQQAQAVSSGAMGMIKSRALDIERVTGRHVLDDQGRVQDPTRVLADLKRIAQRKFGKNQEGMRRALINDFGADLGLAVYRTDFAEVDRVAKGAKDRGKTAKEAEAFRQTPEGKRLAMQLQNQQRLRTGAGESVLSTVDWLNSNLGAEGTMLAAWLSGEGLKAGGSALLSTMKGGAGASASGGGGGSLMSSLGGVLLGGTGLMSGAFVGSAALQGGVLHEIGQDRESMGRDWRNAHAGTMGRELAQQAMQAGDLMPVIGKAGGNQDVIDSMLDTLQAMLAAQNGTNTLLRDQVAAGIADKLQRTPLRVQLPAKANSEGGN